MTPHRAQAQNNCPAITEEQEIICNLDATVTHAAFVGHATTQHDQHLEYAYPFRTGAAPHGYELHSVHIASANEVGTPGAFVMEIHAQASGGSVGRSIATLSGDNPATAGTHEFTANGEFLARNTTYFLVLSAPAAMATNNYYTLTAFSSGTPTGSDGWEIITPRHRRVDGGEFMASGTTVVHFALIADLAPPNSVNEDAASAVTRAITGIANDAIADRISQARNGGGNFNLTDAHRAQTASRILAAQDGDLGDGVKAMLDGSVFAWSAKNSGGGATPSFWASGDYVDIGGDENTTDWNGDVVSIQLGADARMSNGNLIGAAISHSESDIDYTESGASGEQTLTLTALHPYIGWRAANVDADMWASLAYGTGDLERKPETGDAITSDATLIGGAFGSAVAISDNVRMHAKIETARLTLDNAAQDGDDIEVDAHRARFGAEWSRTTRNGDATFRRGLTGGARYDGGDGLTGVGAEVGANIGYDNGAGTAITARIRALVAHDDDYDEWGAGATVRYAAGADGQGFAMRIEPSWGATQSRADELLNSDDALPDRAFDSSGRMDGEIGYGIAYNEGMMTPYSGFRFVDGGHTYRIGARYKLRPIPLEMGFEAYRKQRADIENGALLKASIHW